MATLFELGSPRPGLLPVTSADSPSTSEHALVRAAQKGDRVAYGLLYSRYARMVHGILLARVAPHQVEDLVQDVFLQALPKLPSLRDPNYFPGWLAAIARNRATDFYRNAKAEVSLDADPANDKSAPAAELGSPQTS